MNISVKKLKEGMKVYIAHSKGKMLIIRYDSKTDKYVLAENKTNNILYSYSKLSLLIGTTNHIFNLQDVAID